MTNTTTTDFVPATKRQTFALYCITKKDYRNEGLSFDEASALISKLNAEKGYAPKTIKASNLPVSALIKVGNQIAQKSDDLIFPQTLAEAQFQAREACDKYLKEVGAHPFNCGFASVKIKDARKPFSKFMLKNGGTKTEGGVRVYPNVMTQDVTAQTQWCNAFATVLENKLGVTVYVDSRLD